VLSGVLLPLKQVEVLCGSLLRESLFNKEVHAVAVLDLVNLALLACALNVLK